MGVFIHLSVKMQNYEEIGLTREESKRWIDFHSSAYKEDREMSDKIMTDSPRWSIIIGYYAMHNISKLYLAKVHNLKVTGESVHAKTIHFLSKYIKQESERVLPLIQKAKEEFDAINSSNVHIVPRLLSKGRDERTKTQYYDSEKSNKSESEIMQTAQYFYDNFVVPYISIMEGLL
ncbi:MAG: hypothetical protein ACQEP1_06225 [Nanobdellota archaeon]